jgi:energy-coupling factor transporter ATP-binding protein EcfA2
VFLFEDFLDYFDYTFKEMADFDENRITYFAVTDTRNKRVLFGIKAKDRTKHVYVIGKTGMGKSTLLENMAIQDIQNGEGLAFIDPHGKSAEALLDYVPEHRIKDVLYFAPFDMEHPISFNVMEDIGADKRHLVVSGLMSTFKKIWIDAWSARMEYILQNTLLALLEYPGATLLGVNKVLSDKEYRKKVVDNIKDPATKSFWVDEFAKYTERFAAEAVPAIQNKVGQFTSNPLIRNIIGQPKSSFDLRKIIDERKILIINLSKGLVGEGNASLLGGMLITKIYLAALSRADKTDSVMNKLPNFYLYVDEFQSFANESFADILSEARKYKLNLTMAHQYIEQMAEEVRAAVFGNVGTMIAFRVGAFDAEVLEKEFAPQFTMEDLVNLGVYQVYLKLMIDGVSSQPFSATTTPPIEKPRISYKDGVIANSRMIFGRARKTAEDEIVIQMISGGKPLIPSNQSEKEIPLNSPRKEEFQRNTREQSKAEEPKNRQEDRNQSGLKAALASLLTGEELPQLKNNQVKNNNTGRVENQHPRENPPRPTSETFRSVTKNQGHKETQTSPNRNHSKNNQKDFRAQKPEGGQTLKEALKGILKDQEPSQNTKINSGEERKSNPLPDEKQKAESSSGEIPEADLRKMLEVKKHE